MDRDRQVIFGKTELIDLPKMQAERDLKNALLYGNDREAFKQSMIINEPYQRSLVSYAASSGLSYPRSLIRTGADLLNNTIQHDNYFRRLLHNYIRENEHLADTSVDVGAGMAAEGNDSLSARFGTAMRAYARTETGKYLADALGGTLGDVVQVTGDPTNFIGMEEIGSLANRGSLAILGRAARHAGVPAAQAGKMARTLKAAGYESAFLKLKPENRGVFAREFGDNVDAVTGDLLKHGIKNRETAETIAAKMIAKRSLTAEEKGLVMGVANRVRLVEALEAEKTHWEDAFGKPGAAPPDNPAGSNLSNSGEVRGIADEAPGSVSPDSPAGVHSASRKDQRLFTQAGIDITAVPDEHFTTVRRALARKQVGKFLNAEEKSLLERYGDTLRRGVPDSGAVDDVGRTVSVQDAHPQPRGIRQGEGLPPERSQPGRMTPDGTEPGKPGSFVSDDLPTRGGAVRKGEGIVPDSSPGRRGMPGDIDEVFSPKTASMKNRMKNPLFRRIMNWLYQKGLVFTRKAGALRTPLTDEVVDAAGRMAGNVDAPAHIPQRGAQPVPGRVADSPQGTGVQGFEALHPGSKTDVVRMPVENRITEPFQLSTDPRRTNAGWSDTANGSGWQTSELPGSRRIDGAYDISGQQRPDTMSLYGQKNAQDPWSHGFRDAGGQTPEGMVTEGKRSLAEIERTGSPEDTIEYLSRSDPNTEGRVNKSNQNRDVIPQRIEIRVSKNRTIRIVQYESEYLQKKPLQSAGGNLDGNRTYEIQAAALPDEIIELDREEIRALEEVMQKIPEFHLDNLTGIEITNSSLNRTGTRGTILGFYDPDTKRITCSRFPYNRERVNERKSATGIAHNFLHEIGHHYHYEYLKKDTVLLKKFQEIQDTMLTHRKKIDKDFESLIQGNTDEFFADLYRFAVEEPKNLSKLSDDLQKFNKKINLKECFNTVFGGGR